MKTKYKTIRITPEPTALRDTLDLFLDLAHDGDFGAMHDDLISRANGDKEIIESYEIAFALLKDIRPELV